MDNENMGKVISMKPVITWMLEIGPEETDYMHIRDIDEMHAHIYISAPSFERADELRKQADALLKQRRA